MQQIPLLGLAELGEPEGPRILTAERAVRGVPTLRILGAVERPDLTVRGLLGGLLTVIVDRLKGLVGEVLQAVVVPEIGHQEEIMASVAISAVPEVLTLTRRSQVVLGGQLSQLSNSLALGM